MASTTPPPLPAAAPSVPSLSAASPSRGGDSSSSSTCNGNGNNSSSSGGGSSSTCNDPLVAARVKLELELARRTIERRHEQSDRQRREERLKLGEEVLRTVLSSVRTRSESPTPTPSAPVVSDGCTVSGVPIGTSVAAAATSGDGDDANGPSSVAGGGADASTRGRKPPSPAPANFTGWDEAMEQRRLELWAVRQPYSWCSRHVYFRP